MSFPWHASEGNFNLLVTYRTLGAWGYWVGSRLASVLHMSGGQCALIMGHIINAIGGVKCTLNSEIVMKPLWLREHFCTQWAMVSQNWSEKNYKRILPALLPVRCLKLSILKINFSCSFFMHYSAEKIDPEKWGKRLHCMGKNKTHPVGQSKEGTEKRSHWIVGNTWVYKKLTSCFHKK